MVFTSFAMKEFVRPGNTPIGTVLYFTLLLSAEMLLAERCIDLAFEMARVLGPSSPNKCDLPCRIGLCCVFAVVATIVRNTASVTRTLEILRAHLRECIACSFCELL